MGSFGATMLLLRIQRASFTTQTPFRLPFSRVITPFSDKEAIRHIRKLIMARINLNAPIDEVWKYEKGEIHLLYKKQQGG